MHRTATEPRITRPKVPRMRRGIGTGTVHWNGHTSMTSAPSPPIPRAAFAIACSPPLPYPLFYTRIAPPIRQHHCPYHALEIWCSRTAITGSTRCTIMHRRSALIPATTRSRVFGLRRATSGPWIDWTEAIFRCHRQARQPSEGRTAELRGI